MSEDWDKILEAIIPILFIGWIIWLVFIKKPKIKQATSANATQAELVKALSSGNENPEMILLMLGHDKNMAEQTMLLKYYHECVHVTEKHYSRIDTIARIEANRELEIAKVMANSNDTH